MTVVVPSWPTLTSVTVGFDFLTSSATLALSASVKLLGSTTGVTAGSLTALSDDFLTALSAGITAVVPSG